MEKQSGYLRLSGFGENAVSFEGECTVSQSSSQTTVEFDESASGILNTRTFLAISDDMITLNRLGEYNTFMVFEPKRENPVTLGSPFGNIEMRLFTESVKIDRQADGISAIIRYRFILGAQSMHNVLKLECRTQIF